MAQIKKLFLLFFILSFLGLASCASSDNSEDDAGLADEISEAAGDDVSDEVEDEDADVVESEDDDLLDEDEGNDDLAEEEDEDVEDELEEEEELADNEEDELEEEDQILDEEPLDLTENTEDDIGGPAVDIVSIDFLANNDGGTIVIKTTGEAKFNTRYKPDTQQYVVEIDNSTLPQKLQRPYILKEFESSFGAINAYQSEGSTVSRIVVQMNGPGEPVIQQEQDSLILVPPSTTLTQAAAPVEPEEEEDEEEEEAPAKPAWQESYDVARARKDEKMLAAKTLEEFLTENSSFYGRPISIQTKDADIRDVITFIAEESGVNLVLSDDVTGSISLKLRNVPWDQALVIVMRAKNLGYIRQGNVLRISKLTALQEEAKAAKEIIESQKGLTPLKVKVIPISYANIKDLQKQIEPFLTKERGKVVGDERTSSLIVTDTNDVIRRIQRLTKELDIPPAQVLIEGKIVEATEAFQRNMGVNLGFTGAAEVIDTGGGAGGGDVSFTNFFNSQPAGDSASLFGFTISNMKFLGDLNAALSLAENDRTAKIISSPRVVTMNKEKATITQQDEVVSLVETRGESTSDISIAAKKDPVSLKLEVTPQITSSGSVIMEVDMSRQSAGAESDSTTRTRPISSRSAKTKILVNNGQTAVIGGIYTSSDTESEVGVPGLRKIPILGWLFKSRLEENNKTELLLFLTPRILNAKEQEVDDTEDDSDDGTLFEKTEG